MDDTVCRQQAIDAVSEGCQEWRGIFERCKEKLLALPSAQTEIVRCKDCKHWKFDHTCREHSLVSPMMANEFCSRAERREDG